MTNRRSWLTALWIVAMAVTVALTSANLYLGDLNQDEGWYLYASRLVSQGDVPYRDFAYTQPPLLPYAYLPAQPLVKAFGLAGGRFYTTVLGLLATAVAAFAAARLVPAGQRSTAALMVVGLAGMNVYHSYFTTVVKTYSVAALLLTLGFLCLTCATGRRGRLAVCAAAVLMALAAATRVSAAVALAVVTLALLADRKQLGVAHGLLFAVVGGATLVLLFLPFYLLAPEGFMFGVVEYHTQREGGGLVHKAGFVSRTVQAYFVALAILFALLVHWFFTRRERPAASTSSPNEFRSFWPALWLSVAAVTLVHLGAPFPYDDYQVFLFPLVAMAVAAGLVRAGLAINDRVPIASAVVVVGLGAAAAGSSPLNQEWFLLGRDAVWWKIKDKPALVSLRDTANDIRQLAEAGDELLTQDAYLAVETGLALPRGLEMGPFSYYPEWSTERARKLRVLNRELMEELLRTSEAPVAAISGYGLTIRSPQVDPLPPDHREALWTLLRDRYEPHLTVPNFGQGHTTLEILRRK